MNRRIWVFLLVAAVAPAKKPKDDVNAIGERDVSKGVNLYSLEKEIAL